ncbi:hypothetical protein Tco_1403882 [Tanacetum coccineum]
MFTTSINDGKIKLKAKGRGLAIGGAHRKMKKCRKWVELGTTQGRGSLAAGWEASEPSDRQPRSANLQPRQPAAGQESQAPAKGLRNPRLVVDLVLSV